MTTLAEAIENCIRSTLTPFKGDVITIIAKMLSDGLLSDERFHELHKEINLLIEYYQQDLEKLGFSSEAIHEAIYKPDEINSIEETNDDETVLSKQLELQAKIRLAQTHGLVLRQASMEMGFNSWYLTRYLNNRSKFAGINFKKVSDYINNFLETQPNRVPATIKDMRLKAGLTQKEVSSKLHINNSKYIFIEQGDIPLNKDIAMKLSAVFGCEVPYSE